MFKREGPGLAALLLGATALLASCEKVTVITVSVASVELTPPEASLIEGDSVQLSVVITDSKGNRLSGREITWSVDVPEIATVDRAGRVVGLREGVTAVRAFVETASASSTVTVLRGPTVGVAPSEVIFLGSADGPDPTPATVEIFNDGAGSLEGLVASVEYVAGSPGWLEAALTGTRAPTRVRLSARAGALDPGTYVALVRVASQGARTGTVTVTFNVSESAPVIGLSQSTVEFERDPGDATVAQASVGVTNLGSQELTGLGAGVTYGAAESAGWLVASLSPTTAPATLSLSASAAGLVAGTYTATVDVLSPVALNSPQSVAVSLVVTEPPPSIVLSASSLDFNVDEGAGPPADRSIDVDNGGGGVLSGLAVAVDYGSGPTGWVDARLDQDTAPTVLRVGVDPAGRAPGTYTASVVVGSPVAVNSPQTVTVTLRVGDRSPAIALSESLVRFAGLPGGADPAPVTVAVTNGGGGALTGLSQTVTYDDGQAQGWLQAALLATEAPTDLELRAALGDLASGNYGATVAVSSPQASNSPQTVRVDLVMGSPPSAPSGLSAVAVAPDQVDLEWTDNSGEDEDRFAVERSPGGANAWQEVASVGPDVVAYSDQSVSEGTSYDYRILACAADLCSLPSNVASVTTPTTTTTPDAPSGLGATAVGPTQVDLEWTDNSAGEDRFSVERSAGGANTWAEIATVGADVVAFSDLSVVATTSYDYRVIACTGELCSAPSNVASVTTPALPPPTAPSGLGAAAASPTQVDLDWTDNSDDEDRFSVERSPGGANTWAEIASVGTDVVAYSDASVAPGTAYDYRVRACLGALCSAPSNVAGVTTPLPPPPTAPSGLAAAAASPTRVDLDWTDNSDDEDRFSVERRTGGAGDWAEVASLGADAVAYSDLSVAPGTEYDYRVLACAGTQCSTPSNVAGVTTPLPPPPTAPSGLSATAVSHEQVDLAWTDNSPDEDSFRVERSADGGANWSGLTTTGQNVTAYSDGSVSPETEYSYRVQACNPGGCSDFSSVATATTPAAPTPPAPVSDLTATPLSSSSVRLSWADNSDNEEWFEIRWRRVNQGGGWTEADPQGPNTTTYTATGLQRRRDYEFQVRACNEAGCSTRESVTATTPG